MTFTEEIQGYRTRINTALKEGEAKGKAEGRLIEKIEIAENLLKEGSKIDFIMKITGLSEEEVKQLQSEIEKSYKFFNGAIEKMDEFNMTFTEEIQDYRTRINTAKEEGLAEGIKQGEAQGIEKGKAEGLLEGLEKGLKKGIKKGKLEGKIKGKMEGREEGRVIEKIEIAENLLKEGSEIDFIMRTTGLSEERLKKLQAKIKKS